MKPKGPSIRRYWEAKLRVNRDRAIKTIETLAKKACLDVPLSPEEPDAAWARFATEAFKTWKKSPRYWKSKANTLLAGVLSEIDQAERYLQHAGEVAGGLADVKAILHRLLNEENENGS